MSRYIDAEKLKNVLADDGLIRSDLIALRHIDEIPTANVVEVVRCKDCKYFGEFQHCDIFGFCEPDDYCSRGERRNEDG